MGPNCSQYASSFSWVLSSVSPSPKPFYEGQRAPHPDYEADDVGGSLPRCRSGLQRSLPLHVLPIFADCQQGVLPLGGSRLTDGIGNKRHAMVLELPHALEGDDRLDRDPTLGVAGGKREEELVDGQVGIGEVEVDLRLASHANRTLATHLALQRGSGELERRPRSFPPLWAGHLES